MLAVRYHGPNIPFALDTVPLPILKNAYVLVEVKAAALCHTELHFLDGTLDLGVKSITMGHETVGIISAVGEGVDSSRIGERVIIYYYVGCKKCRQCTTSGRGEQICDNIVAEYGFISDGGLAQYVCIPSHNAVVLPEIIPFELAAPIGCGLTTTVHASKLAEIKAGEWVAIFGTNGIGFFCIQLAKSLGAKIIAIGRTKAKLDKAKELGADETIDATDISTVSASIRSITSGQGADVIFECVGSRESMDQCLGWTAGLGKRGRLVLLGYQKGSENDLRIHPLPIIVNEQKIIGSVEATNEDLLDATVVSVVDSVYPISQIYVALEKMKNNNFIGKIVINNFTS